VPNHGFYLPLPLPFGLGFPHLFVIFIFILMPAEVLSKRRIALVGSRHNVHGSGLLMLIV
jgi:hypothetical protein